MARERRIFEADSARLILLVSRDWAMEIMGEGGQRLIVLASVVQRNGMLSHR
jgi:hypothetical protein